MLLVYSYTVDAAQAQVVPFGPKTVTVTIVLPGYRVFNRTKAYNKIQILKIVI